MEHAIGKLSMAISQGTSELHRVLSNTIISVYLLAFLVSLVMYALVSKVVGKTIDSGWFYVCFLVLNIWISFYVGFFAGNLLRTLFMLFVYFGGRLESLVD